MSDDAAFPRSENPPYRYRHIGLPPSLMYSEDARIFRCVIYGSSIPFKIIMRPYLDVDYLKREIKYIKGALRDHNTSKITLWKLKVPVHMSPENTLLQRIRERGDVEMIAEELTISEQKMSTIFPQRPRETDVHIVVKLPTDDTRSWLAVIHRKLWNQQESFGQIFRTANLTEREFNELQLLLDKENPERSENSYVAKKVLAKKSEFLRDKSTPLIADFGNGLVPRLAFDASQPPSFDVIDNDDVADDDDDAVADDAMDIDADHGYDSHTNYLSNEATAIFPYTIRYMDLTVLNLQNDLRVPLLMLFRNEWGIMIDLFNKRNPGIRGSAVFTGQPGIGKTCLLYSILILCMIRGQRFVFQDVYGKVFIVHDVGVDTPEDALPVSGDDKEVLTLVDADTRCCEPVDNLLKNSKHRILLTSSPRPRENRRWLKQMVDEHAVWVMEPWSREEFVIASLFLQGTDITLKRLQQASRICGNIPRPCFKAALSLTALLDAEAEIKEAIETTNDLFNVVHDGKRGDPIHRAFQIRPCFRSRYLVTCLVQPISAWAFMEMLNVLHQRNRDKAYKFYCSIKGFPDSSQIFETYFHRYLKNPRTFIIKPLDNHAATPEIEFTVNENSHLSFTDVKSLSEHKSETSCYFRFGSFLYQPEISRHAFSPLIALQVTTAQRHDIKTTGLKKVQGSLKLQNTFLKNLRPANNRKMIILFVVPDDLEKPFGMQKITGKGAGAWYNKTAQYVLELPVEDLFKFYEETKASKEMQSIIQ